ncbi:hypothetical protein [Halopseudomonas sp.]|uniref:hypothetical protein n=1 Tax=Halopseudomonas sp. TaxID=2901191 RepID=UPI0030035BFB
MSRKTWRDLARQQAGGGGVESPGARLDQLSAQVPGLQRLLQQRETLEQQMRALGGQPQNNPASRVYPVASSTERRAEQADWERRRARQQQTTPASGTTALQQWWQARDSQVVQARETATQQQQGQLNLLQRLDQRVTQARSHALSRLQQERSDALREPLLRPLTDSLTNAFGSTQADARAAGREPTSLQSFDDRYAQRQRRLLGIETGTLDQLEQRREQAQERRLEQRREARRAERQQDLLQQRAAERRSQRPQLSTD